jgi:hypothetical protein
MHDRPSEALMIINACVVYERLRAQNHWFLMVVRLDSAGLDNEIMNDLCDELHKGAFSNPPDCVATPLMPLMG